MQMGNINLKLQVFRSFSHIFCNLLINWGFSNFSMKFASRFDKKKRQHLTTHFKTVLNVYKLNNFNFWVKFMKGKNILNLYLMKWND